MSTLGEVTQIETIQFGVSTPKVAKEHAVLSAVYRCSQCFGRLFMVSMHGKLEKRQT
jgi:hypothetical protein